MKKFLLGALAGFFVSTLVVMAQHRASEKVVQPQVLVDNARVKMVRWVLKPGEGSPIHSHDLDHVSVVIRGSTLRDMNAVGVVKENVPKTGDATFNPATGLPHSFANAGNTVFESISIELK
jgi:quercetin dioxygenase-like cupin family protein